jgi:hypothetical protein
MIWTPPDLKSIEHAMKRYVLLFASLLSAGAATADTELTIVTPKGHVAFTTADDWTVLQMQSKLPVAVAAFQLPHPADEGTPDSTNLVLLLFEHGSEKEKTVFAAPVRQLGAALPTTESFGGWTIYRQDATQGATRYSIWDAKKEGVADVSASVRLAWPHLANNPANYGERMETTFKAFLSSVHGGTGEYRARDGEVVRRPDEADHYCGRL